MAKREKVNKTQAVKEYLKANRKAKNQEVVDALAKKGIKITVQLRRLDQDDPQQASAGGEEGCCQGQRRDPRGESGIGFPKSCGERYGSEASLGRGSGNQGVGVVFL